MNKYEVGPLTMEYVFRQNGLENVSDWQAVLNAMEKALEYKNQRIRDAYADCPERGEIAGYEDRS